MLYVHDTAGTADLVLLVLFLLMFEIWYLPGIISHSIINTTKTQSKSVIWYDRFRIEQNENESHSHVKINNQHVGLLCLTSTLIFLV